MKQFVSLISALLLLSFFSFGQDSAKVNFSFDQKTLSKDEVQLIITARVAAPGVELFGLQKPQNNDVFSMVTFDSSAKKF